MKRSKPLVRRTRLQRARLPQGASKPLQRGRRPGNRWEAHRRREREYIKAMRVWCQYPGCTARGYEVHHPFGRTGEPWASSRLVCVLICLQHHRDAHANVEDRNRLRMIGAAMLWRWLLAQLPGADLEDRAPDVPLRTWYRYLCNVAAVNGLTPPTGGPSNAPFVTPPET